MAAVAVAALSALTPAIPPAAASTGQAPVVLAKGGESPTANQAPVVLARGGESPTANQTADRANYANARVQLAGGNFASPADTGGQPYQA